MTQLVLETYGHQCWLRLPGCTKIATTKDHVTPLSHGGEDTLENYRPACRHCNSKRQNRVRAGYGASVVVVTGPPAAGKSTYVEQHAKAVDVIIDMDKIARALMGQPPAQSHVYPQHTRHIAMSARKAAIRSATRLREKVTIWLIHWNPSPDEMREYTGLGWQIITIDPGRDVAEARCATMRPSTAPALVARWYADHPPSRPTAASLSPPTAPSSSEPDW